MRLQSNVLVSALLLNSVQGRSNIGFAEAMAGTYQDRMDTGLVKILLTDPSPLHPMGDPVMSSGASALIAKQESSGFASADVVNFAKQLSSKEQMAVCEKTTKVLFAAGTHPAEQSLGGPVYQECMASLEPLLKKHVPGANAVDVLSGCTGLVNDLTMKVKAGQGKLSICTSLIADLHPTTTTTTTTTTTKAPVQAKNLRKAGGASSDKSDAEVLTAVCALTIKTALKGIRAEPDALQLGGTVAPICQTEMKGKVNQNMTSDMVQQLCFELDGRLTLALETGYLYALHPSEALKQAREPNPYARETRKRFCERFVQSVQHEKRLPQASKVSGVAPVTPATTTVTTTTTTTASLSPKDELAAEMTRDIMQDNAPAPKPAKAAAKRSTPEVKPVVKPTVASIHTQATQTISMKLHTSEASVDMLDVVKSMTERPEWTGLCVDLLGSLTSEEGAVTEQYALGDAETRSATRVMTFNADDQAAIEKCATKAKVLAIRAKVLGPQALAAGSQKSLAAISVGQRAESELQNTEAISALIESPWARDACADLAHGYLVAHLAHPDLSKENYCPMYAKDLSHMQVAPAAAAAPTVKAKVPPVATDAATHAAEHAKALETLKSRQKANFADKVKKQQEAKDLAQQQAKAKAEKEAAEAKKESKELAEASTSGSMFLRDMARSNAANADAAAYELDHASTGEELWSQVQDATIDPVPPKSLLTQAAKPEAAKPVAPAAKPVDVKAHDTPAAQPSKAALVSSATAAASADSDSEADNGFSDMFGDSDKDDAQAAAAPPAPDASAAAAAPVESDVSAAAPEAADAGSDGGDGAEFWKQMFQR